MKFKQMIVKKEDLKIGDYILSEDKTKAYLVIDFKRTWLHNHKLGVKAIYPLYLSDQYVTWYFEDLSDKKTIIRLVKK